MKKYIAVLGLLALLTPLAFYGLFQVPPASAQDGESGTKISGLLRLQVEAKLGAVETSAAPAMSRASLAEERVDILQALGIAPEALDSQQIFIYFAQEPTQSQIAELEAIGITLYPDSWIPPVGAHPTGFLIADMPLDKLEALASKDYAVSLDTAERYLEPHNDSGAQKINADDVWGLGYDGTGVRIAVLDSGLDVSHNDIPTLAASRDYSNWPAFDDNIANTVTGHGTHVAGSALGRGTQSGGTYKGMAPDADLIFLKIGSDSTGSAPTAAMVNAIRDAVDIYNADIITVSYGGWHTYHDGTSQTAQAVDYAVSQGAVVFISAGNDANDDQHYSGTVSASSTTGYIQVNVTGAGIGDTTLWFNLVWYDGTSVSNNLSLQFYDSGPTSIPTINEGQTESTRGTEARMGYIGASQGSPYAVPAGSGTYYVKVTNGSTASQDFHIYVYVAGAGSVKFNSPDPDYTIGSPADADSAIAVGAYTTRASWTDFEGNNRTWGETADTISSFSSRGPRVDTGAPPKPNIVAPGAEIISVRDTVVYAWGTGYNAFIIDNDGAGLNGTGPADYYVMGGTSMACPIAAGVAALILDQNPTLTPAQVKQALESNATPKGAAGHDSIYGWGLIDALASLDLTPPTDPTSVASTSHTVSVWSTDNTVEVTWTAASDSASGLDGYSILWDTSANTTPPQVKNIEEGVVADTSSVLADGNSHYFHISSVDNVGNWQSTVHVGPFYIETVPPTDPTNVTSTSHTLSVWSTDNTVEVTWTAASDNTSGLDGYSTLWDTSANTTPPQIIDIQESVTSANSTALADGSSHYFHISSVDNAGNWQSTVHLGPYFIDATPPTMTIAEAEGQYFPDDILAFDSISFNDGIALDDGWYQMDSHSGNWTTLFTNPGSTSWSSGNWTIPDFGLLAEGSHTIYFKASDNLTNVAGDLGEWHWQFYKDTIAPAAVTDLAVSSPTGVSLVLTWTAPADTSPGVTSSYDIRHSSANITANWGSATPCTGVPSPAAANTTQTFTVTGLSDNTIYYFALITFDAATNPSILSNSANGTTHNIPPILSGGAVSPAEGDTNDSFIYSVTYTDVENAAPGSITVSIDGGTPASMTRRSGEDEVYSNGEVYEYSIAGSDLGTATHSFQFSASDGTDAATGDTGSHSGPSVFAGASAGGGGGGGGAGGGGGGGQPSITSFMGRINRKTGEILEDVTAKSEDKKVELTIAQGTIVKNRTGGLLTLVKVLEMEEPPAPPADSSIIGLTYDLGPDGASFDPPITLTFTYDPDDIPAGIDEEDLVIAVWDEETGDWAVLEGCTLDPVTHTITAPVSHFTAFTVLALPSPAAFSSTDLGISPTRVNTGETVTVSVLVTNTGDLTGSYEVILNIDGAAIATEDVTLAGGDSYTVTFTTSRGVAGTCAVEVNGLSGTFTVRTPPAPPAPAPPVPAEAAAPASFTVSDLSVTPSDVIPAEEVTISAMVTNTGGSEGSHTVILNINGVEEDRKEVALGPDGSETVTFTIAKDAEGSYTVNIDGEIGRFNIAPPPVAGLPAEPARPVNWALIGGIIGGVLVVILALWLAVFRRRFRHAQKQ